MALPGLFSRRTAEAPDVDPILDAALDVFADIGVRRATVDDVAKRAHIGRVTVYRKLGGKSEILSAVLVRESQRLFERVREAAPPTEDFEDRVVHAFATTVTSVRTNKVWNRLLQLESATVLDRLTVHAAPVLAGAVEATADVLRGPGAPADDADLLARAELLVRITHSILLTPHVLLDLDSHESVEAFARQHLLPIAGRPPTS